MVEYKKVDIFKRGSKIFEEYKIKIDDRRSLRNCFRNYIMGEGSSKNYFITYFTEPEVDLHTYLDSSDFERIIKRLIFDYKEKSIDRTTEIRFGLDYEQKDILKELISLYNKINNIKEKVKETSRILKKK